MKDEVKEMKLTKGQREFIGTKFPTPAGGVLTVTGVVGKSSGGAVFSLECSICSKDEELWFEGRLTSTKNNLIRHKVPCGCTSNPKWSENQTEIRVQRECELQDYVFNGWAGEYKGSKTKIDLYNRKTGNSWQSTSISMFLIGVGDPEEGRKRTRQGSIIPDEQHIKDFMRTGEFKEGVKFFRSNMLDKCGRKAYWNYTCPVCSNDEYVKAGVCSGVFEGRTGNLKKGIPSCRCSRNYRWSQQQQEYKIQKLCKNEGYTFIGWGLKGGYKNSYSKFKWVCSRGHDCVTSVNSFLNGSRCMECRIQTQKESGAYYGFFPQRLEEDDTLYLLILGNGTCIKAGRTFVNTKNKRLSSIEKDSGMSVEKVLTVYGKHKDIYDLEQSVLNSPTTTRYEHMAFAGSTELLEYSDLGTVCGLLEDMCNSSDKFTLKYE